MLVNKEPERRDAPHEPGTWFEIVRLSWKQLKKARKRRTSESYQEINEMGEVMAKAVFELIKEDQSGDAAMRVVKQASYDESQFDTDALLGFGIVAWSYDEPVSPESIELLDEQTAIWLKQEIVNLTKPPDEEELKN